MYFKVSNRKVAADGIHQFVDPRCLVAGQSMKLVAKMKLVLKGTNQGVACDPADTRLAFGCPPVRIRAWPSRKTTRCFTCRIDQTGPPMVSTSMKLKSLSIMCLPTVTAFRWAFEDTMMSGICLLTTFAWSLWFNTTLLKIELRAVVYMGEYISTILYFINDITLSIND